MAYTVTKGAADGACAANSPSLARVCSALLRSLYLLASLLAVLRRVRRQRSAPCSALTDAGTIRRDVASFIASLDDAALGLDSADPVVYVGRSPGRLDVMGGIADYSGALVLQMPIAEACFVALQK
eukprot:COSAG04_NODE_4256_length_2203_cov_160.303707_2_plen_125_part_01